MTSPEEKVIMPAEEKIRELEEKRKAIEEALTKQQSPDKSKPGLCPVSRPFPPFPKATGVRGQPGYTAG
jgi:hypothetical protein